MLSKIVEIINQLKGNPKRRFIEEVELKGRFRVEDKQKIVLRDYLINIDKGRYELYDQKMNSQQEVENDQVKRNTKRFLEEVELKGKFRFDDQQQIVFRDYRIIFDNARYEVNNIKINSQQHVSNIQHNGNPKNFIEEVDYKGTFRVEDQETKQIILRDYRIIIGNAKYHKHIYFEDFVDFIEKQFNQVKSSSPIYKYYFKILFQILVYLSTIMELIFTLLYGYVNNIQEYEVHTRFYYFSILITILIHIQVQIFIYYYMNVQRNHLCQVLLNYCYYALLGILSYSKVLPFLMFYTRDSSIQQFSFSQINKYLLKKEEEKKFNPTCLFKKRNKPVNIFRDLIFHQTALISMMITLFAQSIPMLIIQGQFNTQAERWNSFNYLSYILLIINILYCLSEHQFIAFNTSFYSQDFIMCNKLRVMIILKFQETKQILQVDETYFLNVEELYFFIQSSKLNEYEKRKCIIQIIKFILKFRILNKIVIINIDSYEPIQLKYLANALEFITIKQIIFFYTYPNRFEELRNTFKNLKNCYLVEEKNQIFDVHDFFDTQMLFHMEIGKRKSVKVNIKRISNLSSCRQRNQQISKFFYLMIPEQQRQYMNDFEALNIQFLQGGQAFLNLQRLCSQQESLDQIKESNEKIIKDITKYEILKEKLGFLGGFAFFFKFYEAIKQKIMDKISKFKKYLKWFDFIIEVLLYYPFLIMKLIFYIQVEKDSLIWVIIILEILNPIIQAIFFNIFIDKLTCTIWSFLFLLLDQLFKLSHFIMNFFITFQKNYFGFNTQIKFKSYTAKYKGKIGLLIFEKQEEFGEDVNKDPLYNELKWRASVNEALYKIPQFFLLILTINKDYAWGFSFVSTLKDGIFGVKKLLEILIIDYLVPALILRTISVEQFFQSLSYINPNEQSIVLENPKSFALVSKLSSVLDMKKYIIDFTKLDFSQFEPKKKQKLLAQFQLALVKIQRLEILKAQELLYFGEELILILKCLRASCCVQQLKLNFQLDKIAPENLWLLNIILLYCPKSLTLQKFEIQVETKKPQYLKLNLDQFSSAISFSNFYFCYSYYQIREMLGENKVHAVETIKIDQSFLQLGNHDIKQFKLDVAGLMDLTDCSTFFNQFTEVKTLKITLSSDIFGQIFSLQHNIKSTKLTKLSLDLENIQLNTERFTLFGLEKFKLTLRNCKFEKQDLQRLLLTMIKKASKKQDNPFHHVNPKIFKNQIDYDACIILNLRSQKKGDFKFNKQEMFNIQQQLATKQVKIHFLL